MTALARFRFSAAARRTLAALAPVVLTDEVEALGLTEQVVDEVELFLRAVPTPVRAGVVAGLATFEASARAVPSSLGRGFSRLPREKAAAHFERWWRSPLPPVRQLAKALKMFLAFSYYEHPRVRERLGYDPDRWIAEVRAAREARFADEIAAHRAHVLAPRPLPRVPADAVRSGGER